MKYKNKIVAFIPARDGSERILNKNFKFFAGHPLILYTIMNALLSNIFNKIIVSTNNINKVNEVIKCKDLNSVLKSTTYLEICERPYEISSSSSNDCEWIAHIFDKYGWNYSEFYMILRPSNPFRTFNTIQKAWKQYEDNKLFEYSLKSVSLVHKHPYKMWYPIENGKFLKAFCEFPDERKNPAFFEKQLTNMPIIFEQNGCIDICPTQIITADHSRYIGDLIQPFFTNDIESIDLNTYLDWRLAEAFAKEMNLKLNNESKEKTIH